MLERDLDTVGTSASAGLVVATASHLLELDYKGFFVHIGEGFGEPVCGCPQIEMVG